MYITQDRRIKPRIDCEYPAIIEGNDAEDGKYSDHARLANLSASGLFMLANRHIENGAKLSVTVVLSNSTENCDAPRLATSGTVVRIEAKPNGTYGVAVKFSHYRFL